jgi:hypothetical protein
MVSQSPEFQTEGEALAYQARGGQTSSSGPAEQTLTSDEAARYLGFSPSWMRQSRMVGKMGPPFYRAGRSIRYLRCDLTHWLEQRRCVPGGEQENAPQVASAPIAPRRGTAKSQLKRRRRRPAR